MLFAVAMLFLQESSFDAARDFARCQALYESFSYVYEARNQSATAEQYRGMARGALLVAEFFAEDYTGEYERGRAMVENFYGLEISRLASLAEQGDVDMDLAEYCHSTLQPIQVDFIDAMRREAYRQE